MATFDGDGLIIDRLADIKTSMQNDLKAAFGEGINLSETSTFGILVGLMSERYYLLWEKLEAVYNASFPEQAYGNYLDEIVALNGLVREPASKSSVTLRFTRSSDPGDGDVTVPLGTQARAPNSSTIWSTTSEATILTGTTTIDVSAEPENTGPLNAIVSSITTLISAPANVGAVTNPGAASPGRIEETDAALKLRRWTELGKSGTATEAGIRSALQAMDIVASAAIILNDTDIIVGSQPPHSIACYVNIVDGSIGDPDDRNAIAQTIWDSKAAGIATYGVYNGTAVDTNGDDQTVYFSEISAVRIWAKVNITITSDYDTSSADDAITAGLETYSNNNLQAGVDVLTYKLESAVANLGLVGILQLSVETSLDDITYDGTNKTIDPEEVAYIEAVDVSIVKTGP